MKVSGVSPFSGFWTCSCVAFAPDDEETRAKTPSSPDFTVSSVDCTFDPVAVVTVFEKELDSRALRELSGKAGLPT